MEGDVEVGGKHGVGWYYGCGGEGCHTGLDMALVVMLLAAAIDGNAFGNQCWVEGYLRETPRESGS